MCLFALFMMGCLKNVYQLLGSLLLLPYKIPLPSVIRFSSIFLLVGGFQPAATRSCCESSPGDPAVVAARSFPAGCPCARSLKPCLLSPAVCSRPCSCSSLSGLYGLCRSITVRVHAVGTVLLFRVLVLLIHTDRLTFATFWSAFFLHLLSDARVSWENV